MKSQGGFTYVIVMFMVAVLAVVSERALRNTLTIERRMKEAELLAVGEAYRNAIRDYYESAPGTSKTYPESLDELLEDRRGTRIRKYLRKRYRDPITGSKEWGVVYASEDSKQIVGVYSLSSLRPVKRDGFAADWAAFTNASSYRSWKFVYKGP